jgi:hypothetical protein
MCILGFLKMYNGDKRITGVWSKIMKQARYSLLNGVIQSTRWSVTDSTVQSARRQHGQAFGNGAETYPFLRIFEYVFSLYFAFLFFKPGCDS